MEDIYSLDETIEALDEFEFVEGFQKFRNQASVIGYEDNIRNISLDVWAPTRSGHRNSLGLEKEKVKSSGEAVSELNWLDDNYTIANIFEESEQSDELIFRVQISHLADDIWYKAPSDRPKKDPSREDQTDEWKYSVEEV